LACIGIDTNLTERGKIDHQAVIAGAETSQAMATTPNRRHYVGRRGNAQAGLNIGDVPAAGDNAGPAIEHAVPNRRHLVVIGIDRTHEGTLETDSDFSVDFFNIGVQAMPTQYFGSILFQTSR